MTEITFINHCAIPEWLPDYKKEFRWKANMLLEQIITSISLFDNRAMELFYFQEGVGSIVVKVTLDKGEVYVIKTTERPNPTIAEIRSYQAMRDHCIRVPQVYAEGVVEGHPFFVMEYISTGTFQDKLDQGEVSVQDVAEYQVEVFVKLKKISGRGYGWSVGYEDGVLVGNFSDIESFMSDWFAGEEIMTVITEHYPNVNWSQELCKRRSEVINENKGRGTYLGSFDFHSSHFFATDPPTFFDSNPRLEPEYFDLACALLPAVDLSDQELLWRRTLMAKYEKEFGPVHKDKLLRALWLQTFRKADSLLLRSNQERARSGVSHVKGVRGEAVG